MSDQLLDLPIAAARLGISRATLYRIISVDDPPLLTVRIGRRRLIPAAEVDRFIAASTGGRVATAVAS